MPSDLEDMIHPFLKCKSDSKMMKDAFIMHDKSIIATSKYRSNGASGDARLRNMGFISSKFRIVVEYRISSNGDYVIGSLPLFNNSRKYNPNVVLTLGASNIDEINDPKFDTVCKHLGETMNQKILRILSQGCRHP